MVKDITKRGFSVLYQPQITKSAGNVQVMILKRNDYTHPVSHCSITRDNDSWNIRNKEKVELSNRDSVSPLNYSQVFTGKKPMVLT